MSLRPSCRAFFARLVALWPRGRREATRHLAEYPEKPIRLLLPFPPGGAVDIVARVVAGRMADDLGRPIVIENKAGAGGMIATDATAKAAPDGYTLLLTTPNHTINAALQPKLPYDTEKDLVPVSIVAEVPELLVSHPAAPFDSFAAFVSYAKQQSRQAQLCVGRQRHAAAHQHGIAAAAPRTRGAPHPLPRRRARHDRPLARTGAAQDGHLRDGWQHVTAGKLRALAYREPRPLAVDAGRSDRRGVGLPGYEGILWIGMVAPAGTPRPVIDKLAAAAMRAVRAPEVAERLRRDGVDPVGGTPAEFAALIAREIAQWREVIAAAKITAE